MPSQSVAEKRYHSMDDQNVNESMERIISIWGKAPQENQNVGLKSDIVCLVTYLWL